MIIQQECYHIRKGALNNMTIIHKLDTFICLYLSQILNLNVSIMLSFHHRFPLLMHNHLIKGPCTKTVLRRLHPVLLTIFLGTFFLCNEIICKINWQKIQLFRIQTNFHAKKLSCHKLSDISFLPGRSSIFMSYKLRHYWSGRNDVRKFKLIQKTC